jgi:hypothetical protein
VLADYSTVRASSETERDADLLRFLKDFQSGKIFDPENEKFDDAEEYRQTVWSPQDTSTNFFEDTESYR